MAKVLSRQRIVSSGSASGLPISIPLSSYALVSATVLNAVNGLAANEVVRVRILSTTLTTDDNSSIVVQNGNLQADAGLFRSPAFSGSPLGRANESAFQGELDFQSNDTPDTTFSAGIQLLLQNTDASAAHTVTAFSVTLEVVRIQYDEPIYTSGSGEAL